MKLTREQAITEHRKMWLWISRQIMRDYVKDKQVRTIYGYKSFYMNRNFTDEQVASKCFCCEYAYQTSGCYRSCPLWWNDEHTAFTCDGIFEHGYYDVITDIIRESYSVEGHAFITLEEAKKAARMAYKIAMLDEKESKEKCI